MLHLFVTSPGSGLRPIRPVLASAVIHGALLSFAFSPGRPAQYATIPRAALESVRYTTLALGFAYPDDARPRHHAPRRAPRLFRKPALPAPPQVSPFDLRFALNVVSSQPSLPELVLPPMSDSLWGDAVAESPFGRSRRAAAELLLGRGVGSDSVTYIARDVDEAATPAASNPKPGYPSALLDRSVEARFSVTFVVDTMGRIDTATIQIPPSVDARFAKAVRDVLLRWHFTPAEVRGRRVRQLTEQAFEFRIVSGQYALLGGMTTNQPLPTVLDVLRRPIAMP